MDFLEKDLEDIIFYADKGELVNRGLFVGSATDVPTHYFRQVKLGNYGVCDLLSISLYGDVYSVTIYELKRKDVNKDTFFQILRYARGVQHLAKLKNKSVEIDMCMIGRKVDLSDFVYLPNIFDNVYIFTYNYDYDGISFRNEIDYFLKNPGL